MNNWRPMVLVFYTRTLMRLSNWTQLSRRMKKFEILMISSLQRKSTPANCNAKCVHRRINVALRAYRFLLTFWLFLCWPSKLRLEASRKEAGTVAG